MDREHDRHPAPTRWRHRGVGAAIVLVAGTVLFGTSGPASATTEFDGTWKGRITCAKDGGATWSGSRTMTIEDGEAKLSDRWGTDVVREKLSGEVDGNALQLNGYMRGNEGTRGSVWIKGRIFGDTYSGKGAVRWGSRGTGRACSLELARQVSYELKAEREREASQRAETTRLRYLGHQLVNAARSGSSASVESAIEDGVDVNFKAYDGSTALIEAARTNNPSFVKRLIGVGADVSLTGNSGETALSIAEERGNAEIVALLRDPEGTRRRAEEEARRRKAEEETRRLAEAERQRKEEEKRLRIEAEAKRLVEATDAASAELRRELTILQGLADSNLITHEQFKTRQQALLNRHLAGTQAVPVQAATAKPDDPLALFADVDFGVYHALVIGIDNYRDLPPLKTAVNDARAVAEVLSGQYNFDTTLLLDPTRAEIIDTLDGFRETLGEGDNFLIYYAGHGWLDEDVNRGYWLPRDASRPDAKWRCSTSRE